MGWVNLASPHFHKINTFILTTSNKLKKNYNSPMCYSEIICLLFLCILREYIINVLNLDFISNREYYLESQINLITHDLQFEK